MNYVGHPFCRAERYFFSNKSVYSHVPSGEDNDNFIETNVVYVYYHKTAMQSKKPLQDNASHKARINQSP